MACETSFLGVGREITTGRIEGRDKEHEMVRKCTSCVCVDIRQTEGDTMGDIQYIN